MDLSVKHSKPNLFFSGEKNSQSPIFARDGLTTAYLLKISDRPMDNHFSFPPLPFLMITLRLVRDSC